MPLGSAVRLSSLRGDGRYRDTFLREFDSLTAENEMKMQALRPRRGQYDFAATDELVRFARRNRTAVRGHTLVWGQALPLWLVDHGALERIGLRLAPIALPALPNALGRLVGETTTMLTGWRRDELMAVMKDHIRTVMRRYEGDIAEWYVVNEPMAQDGSLAPTAWRRFIGPDYVEQALRAARTADPEVKLFINDFAVEYPGAKLDGLVRLARDLVARGVPLDGIGLQSHTHILGTPTRRRWRARCAASPAWASRSRSPRWTSACRCSVSGAPIASSARRSPTARRPAPAMPWCSARASRPGASPTPRLAAHRLARLRRVRGPAGRAPVALGGGHGLAQAYAARRRCGERQLRSGAVAPATRWRRVGRAVVVAVAAPAPAPAGALLAVEQRPHEHRAADDVDGEHERERDDLLCLACGHGRSLPPRRA